MQREAARAAARAELSDVDQQDAANALLAALDTLSPSTAEKVSILGNYLDMARAAWALPSREADVAMPAGPRARLATMLQHIADVPWWRGLQPSDAMPLRALLADAAAVAAEQAVPMARDLLEALRAAALGAAADAAVALPADAAAARRRGQCRDTRRSAG